MKYLVILLIALFSISPAIAAEGRVAVTNRSNHVVHLTGLTIYIFRTADLNRFIDSRLKQHYTQYRNLRDTYESVSDGATEYAEYIYRVSGGNVVPASLRPTIPILQKLLNIERSFWHGIGNARPIAVIKSQSGKFRFTPAPNTVLFAMTEVPFRVWVITSPQDDVFLGEQNRGGSSLGAKYVGERH